MEYMTNIELLKNKLVIRLNASAFYESYEECRSDAEELKKWTEQFLSNEGIAKGYTVSISVHNNGLETGYAIDAMWIKVRRKVEIIEITRRKLKQ